MTAPEHHGTRRQRCAQDATRQAMVEALKGVLDHHERTIAAFASGARVAPKWALDAQAQIDELRAQVRSRFAPTGPLSGRTEPRAPKPDAPYRYVWLCQSDMSEFVMAANTHADIAAVAEALDETGHPAAYIYETEGDVLALCGVETRAAETEMGRLLFEVSRRTDEVVLANGRVVPMSGEKVQP